MNKAVAIASLCAVIAVGAVGAFAAYDGFFRYGNPVPYLAAASKISADEPLVQVDTKDGSLVYIADRFPDEKGMRAVEEIVGKPLTDQLGAILVFGELDDATEVKAEYWSRHLTDLKEGYCVMRVVEN